MATNSWDDPKSLRPHLPDRWAAALTRFQGGGRIGRTTRRVIALSLLIAAGVIAMTPAAADGPRVTAAARDMPVGETLAASDLITVPAPSPPDGAVIKPAEAVGAILAAPVRRGEILTDVRLVDTSGLNAGPGRVAVPVTLPDPQVVGLLRPGVHVAVISVAPDSTDQAPSLTRLTDDAVVLSVVEPEDGALPGAGRDRVVVLAVAQTEADAVTTAAAAEAIALRFR